MNVPTAESAMVEPVPRLRILSLSTVYPNPIDKGFGLFVRSRLRYLSMFADIRVIAPVPLLDYSSPRGKYLSSIGIPVSESDAEYPLDVWHPRWLYPPLGTPLNALALYLRLAGPVRRLRREFPFDVIDSHFGHPEGVTAGLLAMRLGVPYTITLRGNESRDMANPLIRPVLTQAIRGASRIIAVAGSLRKLAIETGADEQRVVTIPNGIDSSIFYPRDRMIARVRYAAPPDVPVILSAGALIERKGHHRTIRALQSLAGRGVRAILWIAGSAGREGSFEQEVRRCAAESGLGGHVRFLGQLSSNEMAEAMSAADLFCLASSREGWPNVVHEATGCGTPVVANDVGGVADMLPSEQYGYVVPRENQAALERAIERALSREWDRQAVAVWGGSRSWSKVAQEVFEQFAAVTKSGRGTKQHAGPGHRGARHG